MFMYFDAIYYLTDSCLCHYLFLLFANDSTHFWYWCGLWVKGSCSLLVTSPYLPGHLKWNVMISMCRMETLKRHLLFSGQEGLEELKKLAIQLEEKIYTTYLCMYKCVCSVPPLPHSSFCMQGWLGARIFLLILLTSVLFRVTKFKYRGSVQKANSESIHK
jgi:hypothetical protein